MKLVFSILSIALIVSTSILSIMISSKNKEIYYLNEKISIKIEEIDKLIDYIDENKQIINHLDTSYKKLNNSYTYLTNIHEELGYKYTELNNETNTLINDIEIYQFEIKKSIEWFNANAILEDSSKHQLIKDKLEESCLEITENSCRIKAGCFYLINKKDIGLEYKYDYETSNRTDKLQSINEFIENEGGDCEDYSLFFKAEYNYLYEKCENKNIILESYVITNENDNNAENYWLNFQKNWYFPYTLIKNFENYNFPNVICGNMYDKNKDKISGHCMIVFSREKIKSINDLEKLDKMIVIEPQDGSYRGKINEEITLINKEKFLNSDFESWVNVVITDDDYYLFSQNDYSWKSYSSFYDDLEIKKNHALELLDE